MATTGKGVTGKSVTGRGTTGQGTAGMTPAGQRGADEVAAAALRVEAATGVPAAVLLAVGAVETNGVAYAAFAGRREPLIRFEGHCFDPLLSGEGRRRARALGLSSPKAGAVRNPAAQSARWRIVEAAAAIDRAAAYASTSWGLGQVMGSHWMRLGFASPEAFVAEARRSAEGQLLLVARFLTTERLDRLLPQGAFAAFARAYNGPGYARNAYDAKIAAAYAAAVARLAARGEGQGEEGRAEPAETVAKGWFPQPAMLSSALSWLTLRPFVPMPTRSSSISTGRSSALPTTRTRSASRPPPSSG